MLRVRESKSAAAAIKYLRDGLVRGDYYSQGNETQGRYIGKGAERLGLEGEVKDTEFAALVNNRNPKTGEKLTVRNKKNRRPGYDAVLSAWKSASVMDGVVGCRDIREAFVGAGDAM